MSRTDTAVRVISASPDRVFAALTDSDGLAVWPPPDEMTGRFEHFDTRPGGSWARRESASRDDVELWTSGVSPTRCRCAVMQRVHISSEAGVSRRRGHGACSRWERGFHGPFVQRAGEEALVLKRRRAPLIDLAGFSARTGGPFAFEPGAIG